MKAATALRQARRRAGLTQRRLAAKAGVPQSTVARIESSAMDPRVSTLDALLRACGDELRAVPRIGIGIDRTVARANLTATPDQRMHNMVASSNNLARLMARLRPG